MRHCLIAALALVPLSAAQHEGRVKFGGLPLPGASVTATQGEKRFSTITDAQGAYSFADLADGTWTIQVQMQLFSAETRDIAVSQSAPAAEFEMNLLPEDQIGKIMAPRASAPTPIARTNTKTPYQRTDVTAARAPEPGDAAPATAPDTAVSADLARRAADGLLINGSVNNGAFSPFAQLPAFGNNRRGPRPLYNGNLGLIVNHSSLDARAFSLTGQDTPKPAYTRIQGLFSFGGPIRIPKLLPRNGPNFTLNYQWTRNSNANTQTGLMPTRSERGGDFSAAPQTVLDPATGVPFAGNVIPAPRISPQATALLNLYPLPNFSGSSRYNFQIPIVSGMHQDDLQSRVSKQKRRNFFAGNFSLQSTRTDNPNLFGFLDTGRVLGINSGANYRRTFSPRTFVNFGLQFSRLNTRVTPFFADRQNISGDAGIRGNNQEATNWGPPALSFSTGISALGDVQSSFIRNQTSGLTADGFASRGRHYLSFGGVRRWQEFNVLSQQDARGTFTFTGAAAAHDFAGFLLGVPDTSSIAFGNADKYLRASITEAFVVDDFRVNPGLTLNVGLRWEYWSPVNEKYGRLVNLVIAPGFSAVTPVIAGQSQSAALPQPDRNNFSPRVAFSWRPMPASSMVIRGGYGVYYDTSVYQPIAMQMAQQAPLSKSLRVSNSTDNPLTLADGFNSSGVVSPTTFAIDPGFRVGYSQNWQLSIQRDLPGGLQMTATYSGGKGTRAQQQFLPNTFPAGAVNPCPACPSGFTYLVSNGNSMREAGQIQLRRRLRSGFTAQLQYVYSKSIDDAMLGGRGQGGSFIAQNWLDLAGERGLSNFDQRHLLAGTVQYTTGMGLRGGALANRWRGRLLKEWTFGSQITIGSGLPLTPVYLAAVSGTGVTGTIRPDYTGLPLYDAPSGLFLNPAAYIAPAASRWGNAGRNSITGPSQFVLNASLGRTFRSTDRVSFDVRIDAANALNYVTFPTWNTIAGNAQFGLPNNANPMRTVQTALRMRF